jgi:2-polyprenyl-3-methyl-5-hydroxy-6-metoxy-1,4-benzoquinol methylase
MTARSVVERAHESHGASEAAILRMLVRALDARDVRGGTVVDVGCGRGDLFSWLEGRFVRYVGADVVRHVGFPTGAEFCEVDLDRGSVALADEAADTAVCIETIEHVENPRQLVRELTRLVKPGGWIFVTTPNQLSLASKLALVFRNEFLAFQRAPGLYPAHITALVESDLLKIADECGLVDASIEFSASGRVPFTARRWPGSLARTQGFFGRHFSDSVLVAARKPTSPTSA